MRVRVRRWAHIIYFGTHYFGTLLVFNELTIKERTTIMPKRSLFCVVFVGKMYSQLLLWAYLMLSLPCFQAFWKHPSICLGKYPKVILSLGFLFVRLWVILSLGYFFLVHLSIMKEGTQPTNWGCSPNHLLLLFCWCFRGFLVGIDTQFILDTFSKVPLYCLSEVYNFDVVILCGPSLIFAGCIFGVGGWGARMMNLSRSFASQMRPSPSH